MEERQMRGWGKFAAVALLMVGAALNGGAQTIPAADPDTQNVPVYVSDFELPVRGLQGPAPALPRSGAKPPTRADRNVAGDATGAAASPVVYLDSDGPAVQARKLIDYFSDTLVRMLKKSGYTAERQPGGPDKGVLLRGVFTEVDAMNRVRRAMLGGASTNARYTLYVGTFNLARPDQPLYQLAPVQDGDNRFGPVLTLNTYVPMVKYELDKNPTEEDVKKICRQIVGNLGQLLKANSEAFAQ